MTASPVRPICKAIEHSAGASEPAAASHHRNAGADATAVQHLLARDEMKGAKCEVRRLHTLSLACAPRGVEGSSAEATRVSGEGGPADEQCARRGCSCDASASAAIAVATRSVSARAGAVRAARGARAAAACLVHRVGQVDHVRAASNRLLSLDACESVTGRRTARRPLIDVRRGRRRACRTWR